MQYANPQYYLRGAHVPKIFLEMDQKMNEEHKNDPVPVTKIKEIPMPFIHGCKGSKGKIIVTEDWVLKKQKKRLKNKAKDLKETQIEMMQLIGKRDRLRFKLGELDPSKKKDSRQIVAINIQLKDIDAELKMLQEQSGINLTELDHGTKFGRVMGAIKRWCKKKIKKIKKFFNDNSELITGMASIILPVIIPASLSLIFRPLR